MLEGLELDMVPGQLGSILLHVELLLFLPPKLPPQKCQGDSVSNRSREVVEVEPLHWREQMGGFFGCGFASLAAGFSVLLYELALKSRSETQARGVVTLG